MTDCPDVQKNKSWTIKFQRISGRKVIYAPAYRCTSEYEVWEMINGKKTFPDDILLFQHFFIRYVVTLFCKVIDFERFNVSALF